MRILDTNNNRVLKHINIYLTLSEAQELISDLQRLISQNIKNNHAHVDDDEYKHSVTIALYDQNSLEGFDDRSKILILQDI